MKGGGFKTAPGLQLLKNSVSNEPYQHISFNSHGPFDFRASYRNKKERLRPKQESESSSEKDVAHDTIESKQSKTNQESSLPKSEKAATAKADALVSKHSSYPDTEEGKEDQNEENINFKKQVVIRVCDDVRKVTKKYSCSKQVLLTEMKYFKSFFKKASDKVDISVHCDIHVFEWLMRYVQHNQNKQNVPCPKFSVRAIVSILVSSEFLGMDSLVEKALVFIRDNIGSVISLPISLSCLSENIKQRLSHLMSAEDLGKVQDSKNKMIDFLFRKKIEDLLGKNLLCKCRQCENLYLHEHEALLVCPNTKPKVDFNGNISARHCMADEFDFIEDYIVPLRQDKKSWKCIYWQTWSLSKVLKCKTCEHYFQLSMAKLCPAHTGQKFSSGQYSCCSKTGQNFTIYSCRPSGCISTNHVPNFQVYPSNKLEEMQEIWRVFTAHEDGIFKQPQKSSYMDRSASRNETNGAKEKENTDEPGSSSEGDDIENEISESSDDGEYSTDDTVQSFHVRSVKETSDPMLRKRQVKKTNIEQKWKLDMQREEDIRRIRRYSSHLLKQRKNYS